MGKCTTVLLIDDDAATNFFHEEVIRQSNCSETVFSIMNAELALDYFRKANQNNEAFPDAVFLDLNMPGMDGIEFLEVFDREFGEKAKSIKLFALLSTTIEPEMQAQLDRFDWLNFFVAKPLTLEKVSALAGAIQ